MLIHIDWHSKGTKDEYSYKFELRQVCCLGVDEELLSVVLIAILAEWMQDITWLPEIILVGVVCLFWVLVYFSVALLLILFFFFFFNFILTDKESTFSPADMSMESARFQKPFQLPDNSKWHYESAV